MALEIKASGQVNKDSGLVEVVVFLVEGEIAKPQFVQVGFVELVNEYNATLLKIDFNQLHANNDGGFRIRATRLPKIRKARIVITTIDDVAISKEAVITINQDVAPDDVVKGV